MSALWQGEKEHQRQLLLFIYLHKKKKECCVKNMYNKNFKKQFNPVMRLGSIYQQ